MRIQLRADPESRTLFSKVILKMTQRPLTVLELIAAHIRYITFFQKDN